MFRKDQMHNKTDIVEKRTHSAPLGIVPTSTLTGQILARLRFGHVKKFKFVWRTRDTYQLR